MKNSDTQAYPCVNPAYDGNWDKMPTRHGLTKLEHFAGMAMQGQITADPKMNISNEKLAEIAVGCAKALLEELEKQK